MTALARSTEQVLRLILRLLDLSRDLERNKDDTLFAKEGGRIIYAFDATVFEVFVKPHDHRGRATSLYGLGWERNSSESRSFAAQSALLTVEYLLSGELPGQSEPLLLMTQWHRWEFARRLTVLNHAYAGKLANSSEQEISRRFDDLRKLLKDHKDPPVPGDIDSELRNDALDLRRSLKKAATKIGVQRDILRSFLATRWAVKILADDDSIEPAEQLLRAVIPPLKDRFSTLHLSFAMPSAEESKRISGEAARWRDDIIAECRRHKIEILESADRGGRARTKGAINDDARSLAFVQWAAANRVKEKERLVLVTADEVLFNAYRRWYANINPDDVAYEEPFCLRRATQYAPIFNLNDSRNILRGDVHIFFEQLLGVLEMTLLPLNLARQKGSDIQTLARMRELTALRELDEDPIDGDLSYLPLRDALIEKSINLAEIEELRDRWFRLERTGLGLADAYLKARLSQRERKFAEFNILDQTDKGAADEALKSYVGELIGTLEADTRQVWLPIACEFIQTWEPPKDKRPTRAPIAILLELSVGNKTINLGARLDERAAGDDTAIIPSNSLSALERSPELLFAVAASLSLVSDDWNNADKYAEMAYEQAVRSARSESDPVQFHELSYLNALTKRFRIGGIAPPANFEAYDRIKFPYNSARRLLTNCVDFYKSQPGRGPKLRYMRALSERAALNLFFAAALTPAVADAGVRATHPDADEALQALRAAELDLNAYYNGRDELPPMTAKVEDTFLAKLNNQVIVNTAAHGVLRFLLTGAKPQDEADTDVPAGQRVARRPNLTETRELLRRWNEMWASEAIPLFKAEMLSFLALNGDKIAVQELQQLNPRPIRPTLRLDNALLRAILNSRKRFRP